MLALQKLGSVTFDYGNNIRTFAFEQGVKNAYDFPGFVPAYIRPAILRRPRTISLGRAFGRSLPIFIAPISSSSKCFRGMKFSAAGLRSRKSVCAFRDCPPASAGSAMDEREKFGLALNDLVARGELKAPIVIGRDHLDCGSVASPFRETEKMRDGSDAVADWPLLNALLNTASGASWVSIHNGGGVGIGYSLHAGQVLVADGTPEMAARIERVLTNDPGIGVARHADAGYSEAIAFARKSGINIPMPSDKP